MTNLVTIANAIQSEHASFPDKLRRGLAEPSRTRQQISAPLTRQIVPVRFTQPPELAQLSPAPHSALSENFSDSFKSEAPS